MCMYICMCDVPHFAIVIPVVRAVCECESQTKQTKHTTLTHPHKHTHTLARL